MNQNKIDDIYFNAKLKKRVIITSNKINKNLDKTLKEILVNEFEGKCVKEGYIKEDSIEIIERSSPYLYGNQFNGNVAVDIKYKAKICCPMRGNIIECLIEKINKLGILAVNGPLSIIIARQFHKDKTLFKDLNENKKVLAKVIDKRFNINENKISVIAELYVINKKNKKSDNQYSDDQDSDDQDSDDQDSDDNDSEDQDRGNQDIDDQDIDDQDIDDQDSDDQDSDDQDSDDQDSDDLDSDNLDSENEDSEFSGGESKSDSENENDQKSIFEDSDEDYNDKNILEDSEVDDDKYESNNESDNMSNNND